MFAFTVLMSSWAWTKTSINTWKRFFNRCFGSKDKSPNIKKHELISKAFQKRYEFNRGRFSLSLNSNNEDPVGMNLENSSATSGLSSSWARSLPHFVSRRNAIAGIVPFVPRHYSSASDVSHHMSIDSYNQPNLDSASLQASEEYVLRHQRRKTKKERMRLWKTNRWFPRTRRDSDTSLQSSMISAAAVAAISAAQNQDVKISRATSTGDLGNQVLPMNLVPPNAVPPVFVRQASTRRTIPREEFKPHFTHGMTDNSHLLKQTNTASSQNTNQRFTPNPSSVNVCNVDQRFTPSSMMVGFSNPMNGLMPSAMYGQGFDYLNAMSYGYMGGMYPGMNGIYGAYPQNAINPNFNYAAFGVMPYASPYGTYPSNTEIVNSPSLIPMNPRVESASETEYFPIVMSDSEFTDTGHRSYDEVMTTQRLLQERAQAQALAAAQVEPVQHKTVLEPQACAKTEFLKRIGDSCTVKLKNCRPPSRQDRTTAHSEVPPPSPADSLKSDEDYEDDDVFECFVNEENETSLNCNLNEQTEETNLFQKLKSSIQNALPSNNCQEPAEILEMDSLEHISLNTEAALASNTLKEECVNESERETLINAKDGNENVSR
ncbi:protein smoothened [Caerostris extrusa]|uniref:Protein smoothened n=1 Tax=Caerostris extrusa TaxID=172846 RepID=A0AAV4MS99_CAEEX|nr:protein smoothened [Caerostris extrusa]